MANLWEERKRGLEEEYFRRKKQDALEKTRRRLAIEDGEKHQQAVFTRCPKCGEQREQVIFQDITVDRCSGCQGVWLEPGELERLTSKESRGWLARFLAQHTPMNQGEGRLAMKQPNPFPWSWLWKILGVGAVLWLLVYTWQLWLLLLSALILAASMLPVARLGERWRVPRSFLWVEPNVISQKRIAETPELELLRQAQSSSNSERAQGEDYRV